MAKASTPPATGKKIELADVNQTLLEQNKTLGNTNSLIKKMVDEAVKARKAAKDASGDDEENRREAKKNKVSGGPKGFGAGLKSGVASGLGIEGLGSTLASFADKALGFALGGTTVAAVAGMAGKFIGRAGVRGGLGFLVGKFGEDALKSAFDSIDPNDMLDQSTKNTISKSLSGATSTALYGSIFGKKAAIAGFAGSLIGDLINGALSPDAKQATIKAFGMDTGLKTEDFISYGSMIGAFFGPELISSAIDMTLTGGSGGGGGSRGPRGMGRRRTRRLSPNILSGFRRNFMGKSGLAVAIMGAGTLIGSVIGDATGSQTASDVAGWVTNGMSLGSMFGPTGIIVGAVAGMALGAGQIITDIANLKKDDVLKKIKKDIDEADFATFMAVKNNDSGAALNATAAAAVPLQNLATMEGTKIGADGIAANAETEFAALMAREDATRPEKNKALFKAFAGFANAKGMRDSDKTNKLAEIVKTFMEINSSDKYKWTAKDAFETLLKNGANGQSDTVSALRKDYTAIETAIAKSGILGADLTAAFKTGTSSEVIGYRPESPKDSEKVATLDPRQDLISKKENLQLEIEQGGLSPVALNSKKKELAGIETQLKNLKPADGNLTTLPIDTTRDDRQPVPEVQVTVAPQPEPKKLYQRKPINIQNAMERIKTKVAEQGTDTEITSTDIQPAPAIDKPKIEPVEKESWFQSLATSISEKLGILQSGSDTTKAPVQMIINSVDNSKGSTNVKTGGGSTSQTPPPAPSARNDVNYAFN
jgi:hypothetical protein